MRVLPDGGDKLRNQVVELKNKLIDLEKNRPSTTLTESSSVQPALDEESLAQRQDKEDNLRKQIQMKKWALGNAVGEQRSRLRSELAGIEKELFDSVMSNKNAVKKYQSLAMSTSKHPAIQLLPEAPRMTDIQRRMFAEQPTEQQLYMKGSINNHDN